MSYFFLSFFKFNYVSYFKHFVLFYMLFTYFYHVIFNFCPYLSIDRIRLFVLRSFVKIVLLNLVSYIFLFSFIIFIPIYFVKLKAQRTPFFLSFSPLPHTSNTVAHHHHFLPCTPYVHGFLHAKPSRLQTWTTGQPSQQLGLISHEAHDPNNHPFTLVRAPVCHASLHLHPPFPPTCSSILSVHNMSPSSLHSHPMNPPTIWSTAQA